MIFQSHPGGLLKTVFFDTLLPSSGHTGGTSSQFGSTPLVEGVLSRHLWALSLRD